MVLRSSVSNPDTIPDMALNPSSNINTHLFSSSSYGGDLLSPGSRNWGIKYEPVSIMVYEHKYNTTVNTKYGCIPH